MTPMRLEPVAPRSRVEHSTTEPLRSLIFWRHTASFKFLFSKVRDFENLELSPMIYTREKQTNITYNYISFELHHDNSR